MSLLNRISFAGKTKIVLLVIFCLPSIFSKMPPGNFGILYSVLPGLIFGSVMIPLFMLLNRSLFKKEYDKPSWNDNLFKKNKTLSWNQFFAFFFISIGFCITVKTAIHYKSLSEIGMTSLSFGLGILIGTYISIFMLQPKMQKSDFLKKDVTEDTNIDLF